MEEVVSCPSCGGEVSPRAARCKHCGVRLKSRDDDVTLVRATVPPRPATGDLSSLVPESPARRSASAPPQPAHVSAPEQEPGVEPSAEPLVEPVSASEGDSVVVSSVHDSEPAPAPLPALDPLPELDAQEPQPAIPVDKQHANDPTMALAMDDVEQLVGSVPQDTTDVNTHNQGRVSQTVQSLVPEQAFSFFGRVKEFFANLFK